MRSTNKVKIVSVLAIVVFLTVFFIVFPCSFGVNNPRVLLGTYFVEHEYATEKIILKKEGVFIHEVTAKGSSKTDVAEGQWKYNADSGYLTFDENFMIVVDGFNKFIPDYAKPRSSGIVGKSIDKFFGNISISRGDRKGYKKID